MTELNITKRQEIITGHVATIKDLMAKKELGLVETMQAVHAKINDEINGGLGYKKALKVVKESVLEDLHEIALNKRGAEYLKNNASKEINRVFNIAFTAIYRKMDINFDLITVSQAENLTNHGKVDGVNNLIDKDGDYTENVVAYIKSLKTRETKVMTFEKKAKLA